jgi:hypothetical protein
VIYFGADLVVYLHSIPHVDHSAVIKVAAILMVLGSILFVISFFGCLGAYKQSYCMISAVCYQGKVNNKKIMELFIAVFGLFGISANRPSLRHFRLLHPAE